MLRWRRRAGLAKLERLNKVQFQQRVHSSLSVAFELFGGLVVAEAVLHDAIGVAVRLLGQIAFDLQQRVEERV